MGFNATVVVLMDRLDEIERDPDFGKKLSRAIRFRASFGNSDERSRRHSFEDEATGQTKVIEVHHADHTMVVAVGGNTGRAIGLGGSYRATDDEIITRLASDKRRRNREAKAKSG